MVKEEKLNLPVLKLAWRAAIVSSIREIERDDGVNDITSGVSAMMGAPVRPSPRK
jgi:hypothetical protein